MNMVLQYIYLIRKCFVSVQDEFSFLEYIICSVKSNFIINIFKNVVYYFKYNFFSKTIISFFNNKFQGFSLELAKYTLFHFTLHSLIKKVTCDQM